MATKNLRTLYISESFQRLLQLNPNNNLAVLDGTGSGIDNLNLTGIFSSSFLAGDGQSITNIPTKSINDFDTEVSRSAAYFGFTSSGSVGVNWGSVSGKPSGLVSSSTQTIDNLNGTNILSGSILTSSITNFDTEVSRSVAEAGFGSGGGGSTAWVDITGKPSGLVSSSTQTINNLNGTNIVSSSTQTGSVLGLGPNDTVTFGSVLAEHGGFSGNVIVDGTLTAREYVVSSSVINVTQSYSSGSTIFGDTLDDTHLFTGSVDITGSLLLNGTDLDMSFDGNRTVSRSGVAQVNVGTSGSVKDFLEEYFFPFIPATLSISGTSTYETGSSQNITISVNITENDETSITNGSLRDLTNDVELGTFTTDDSFADNGVIVDTSYSASMDVDNNGSPTTIDSSTITATFIYPYFYGMHPSSSLSGTELYDNLTKSVENQGNKTVNYNDTDKYIYFVIPDSWSDVQTILDPNSFDVTDSFTTSSVSVTSTGLTNNYTSNFTVYRSGLTTANGNFQFQF